MFVLVFTCSQTAMAYDGAGDLRDSCRTQFAAARQSEQQLESLKNLPLRMIRIGGELDVALYDRLAQVRRQRIAAASVSVRTAQSALSGCLARQVSLQQAQRMPASVLAQPASRPTAAREQVYAPQQPVQSPQIPQAPLQKKCDPETEEYGCPIEAIRVGQ